MARKRLTAEEKAAREKARAEKSAAKWNGSHGGLLLEHRLGRGEVGEHGTIEVDYLHYRNFDPYFRLSVERVDPETGELMRNKRVKLPLAFLAVVAATIAASQEKCSPAFLAELGKQAAAVAAGTPAPARKKRREVVLKAAVDPIIDGDRTYLVDIVSIDGGRPEIRFTAKKKGVAWKDIRYLQWEPAFELADAIQTAAQICREWAPGGGGNRSKLKEAI